MSTNKDKKSIFFKIWDVPDLRSRIILTLSLLAVYRFGSYIILPGIDKAAITSALNKSGDSDPGLLDLLNTFSGGAFFNGAIFALGIMPYISASIIVQLLGFAIPYFQKLQKEGEPGQRRLNQITRYITIAITMVQGSAYLNYMHSAFPQAISSSIGLPLFWLSNIVILTAGTIFCMWLGERITDKGIGNGISLIITAGIVATIPQALLGEFGNKFSSTAGGPVIFVVEMALFVLVVLSSIALVQAVREIRIKHIKHSMSGTGRNNLLNNIPIKLNSAGVMPIIFAQAIMFIPGAIAQSLGASNDPSSIIGKMQDFTSLPYNIVFFLLVVIFTYVYTAMISNPRQYEDYLRNSDALIPNVDRGQESAYIDEITTRITLSGAIALGIIAIFPGLARMFLMIDINFAVFFGGTSLLIMVSVVLETINQINAHLSMHGNDVEDRSTRTKKEQTSVTV
jgi:preprotein translocase subunit SecY